ncbi:MAG: hypothetical protein ACRC2K_03200, partial [Clostridium sp.]
MIKIIIIYLSKNDEDIKIGQNFEILVRVTNIKLLQSVLSFHHVLKFNPYRFTVIGYDVSNSVLNPLILPPLVQIDNAAGIVDFDMVRKGAYYSDVSGIIYRLKCKAKCAGSTIVLSEIIDMKDNVFDKIATKTYPYE